MDDAPQDINGLSTGHWLGLGCGVLLAIVAMVVIGLVNARRPTAAPRVALAPVPTVAGATPGPPQLTAVEAQPERDPFARPGGVPEPASPNGEEPSDGGDSETPTPPQPVVAMPPEDEPPADESPADEPPDLPEPSTRGRQNRPPRDERGDDGGDQPAADTKPPKPKMPTVAELKPHDPQEPPAWALPPQAAEGGLELVAVIASAKGQAVFRKEGAYHRVRVGDTIEGLAVERIDAGGVYLKDGDHRYLMRMPDPIRPGGQRGGTVAARPAAPAAPTPEPARTEPEAPVTPSPTMAPAPTTPSPSAGGQRPSTGQRPSGGQRPGGGMRPGGGQGSGSGGGWPGGGGWNRPGGEGQGGDGGFGGRRRPSDDEGE